MQDCQLNLQGVSLKFRRYTDERPTLKRWAIQAFHRSAEPVSHTDFWALQDIDWQLLSGDKVGIVGPNGAGKSTLLRTIAGIYPPTRGRINGCGMMISLLELGTGFDATRTARENVYLCGATLGFQPKEMRQLVPEILQFAELPEFADTPVNHLSSGMRSRLAFSIAASVRPDILLLDEIFAAGDARFIAKARRRMREMVEASHILVFVSHSDELIREFCNKAVFLNAGRIVSAGSVDEILDRYNREVVNA
jgi:ABC-type polysaccharide/polyol phosphate transport system ATPase subunit